MQPVHTCSWDTTRRSGIFYERPIAPDEIVSLCFLASIGDEGDRWFLSGTAGAMASRRETCFSRKILPVLLMLLVPSEALTGIPVHTWRCFDGRESFVRCQGAGADRVDARDGGKMRSSGDPSRPGELELEEMELWLDEAGVDRRGGGKGTPSAKLQRFSGRGIGLEAAVDLERDSTVRHKATRLYKYINSRVAGALCTTSPVSPKVRAPCFFSCSRVTKSWTPSPCWLLALSSVHSLCLLRPGVLAILR